MPVALFTGCAPHLILLLSRIIFGFLSTFCCSNLHLYSACSSTLRCPVLVFDNCWASILTIMTRLHRRLVEKPDSVGVLHIGLSCTTLFFLCKQPSQGQFCTFLFLLQSGQMFNKSSDHFAHHANSWRWSEALWDKKYYFWLKIRSVVVWSVRKGQNVCL